jgi:hypothetical protein
LKNSTVDCDFNELCIDGSGHWLASKDVNKLVRTTQLHCNPMFLNTHTNNFSSMDTLCPSAIDDFMEMCCKAGTHKHLHKLLDDISTVPTSERKPISVFSEIFTKKH